MTFDDRLRALDLALFESIDSQSTDEDKRSLLACQVGVGDLIQNYGYLEIGSHLGGSIQPHLVDPRCASIWSIDKRQPSQPDERGVSYTYLNNSTGRMMDLLAQVDAGSVQKVNTIDGSTESISPTDITAQIHLCFIDGEHTDEAVQRDFDFCLSVLGESGAIVFHDAQITYKGIAACVRSLEARSEPFHAYSLASSVFVVEVGSFALHKSALVHERLVDNHKSYLFALQDNDHYRTFANRAPFQLYRRTVTKLRRRNRFD